MDSSKQKKLIVSALMGAVAGFLVSFALLKIIDTGSLGDVDSSRVVAALVGALYLVCSGGVGLGLVSPKMGAKYLNVEDAEELEEQRTMLRNSILGIAAFGAALIVLAFAAPVGPIPAQLAVGVIALLMVASTVVSRRMLKSMDELNASLSRETAEAAFYAMLIIGGGWAALAHLEFLTAPAAIDWLSMFAMSMFAGAFWAAGRRGLLVPR